MKKQDIAKLINVSRNTITNWEKEKPELMKLIRMGLQIENHFEQKSSSSHSNTNQINEIRKKEILQLLKVTNLEQFRWTISLWIEFAGIETKLLDDIKKAKSKNDILSIIKALLIENQKYKDGNQDTHYEHKYLIANINDDINFDFNTTDIDIITHIFKRYFVYQNLYKFDNQKKAEQQIVDTLCNIKYSTYTIPDLIDEFGVVFVEKTTQKYKNIFDIDIHEQVMEKIEISKINKRNALNLK